MRRETKDDLFIMAFSVTAGVTTGYIIDYFARSRTGLIIMAGLISALIYRTVSEK